MHGDDTSIALSWAEKNHHIKSMYVAKMSHSEQLWASCNHPATFRDREELSRGASWVRLCFSVEFMRHLASLNPRTLSQHKHTLARTHTHTWIMRCLASLARWDPHSCLIHSCHLPNPSLGLQIRRVTDTRGIHAVSRRRSGQGAERWYFCWE